MAGIFQPNLQTDVQYERPTQMASPLASIAQLGSSVISGLSDARARAEREAKAREPSYSQVKDEREAQNLADYATQLDSIQQMQGQISNSAYNLKIRQLNMDFLGRGVDISSSEYDQTREVVTGMPSAMVGRSDDEILVNNLRATPEGQAELSFAAQQLQAEGLDVTSDNIASVVRQREVTKLAVDNLQIQDEASFRKAKPIINDMINMFQQDTQNAVFTLREAGVPLTSSMIQQRYVDFIQLQTQITSSIPANIPTEQKNEVLGTLGRMEEFFIQLGMTKENGEIKLLNQNELQVQDKTRTFVSILGASDNAADNVLAMKLMDKNYVVDPATYSLIESRIAELGATTDITPDWIEDSDIVVTNDLIKTYDNFIQFEQAGGVQQFTLDNKLADGAMSLVSPEERDKWASLTNAQGWTATKAFGEASKGFSKEAILSGQMTDGFYNTVAGLALSLESIDILEEPVSFAGMRKEVSSKLPDLIKTAEAVDPAKGAAIRSLMFRSLSSQKFQYDTRISSDESALGIEFNPQTRTYNLSAQTSDPAKLTLIRIVNNNYNGDLVAATADGFSKATKDDLSLLPSPSETQTDINRAVYTLRGIAPQVDDIKTVLDMRSSSVYLSNLATQLEPQAAKGAREDLSNQSEGTTQGAQTFESIRGFNVIADDGAFLGAVENVSQDLGINSADLLTAISFETVGTFNPAIKNPNSTATGLIQFLESTAKGLGTSTAELAQMSNVEQMAYVKKYLEPYKGRMKNLGDVYMAIHWPAGVGKDDSYVMYREGSENYRANKGLDVSGDGTVTRGEALQRVRQSAGSGGQGSIPQDQRITTAELPPREAEAQTTAPAQGVSAPAQTATDSTTIQAEAALDTEVGQEERTRTPSTPVAATAQPAVSQDVQNFLDSLSEEEKQSLLQILGGQ